MSEFVGDGTNVGRTLVASLIIRLILTSYLDPLIQKSSPVSSWVNNIPFFNKGPAFTNYTWSIKVLLRKGVKTTITDATSVTGQTDGRSEEGG